MTRVEDVMQLDYSSLKQAIEQLEKSLRYANSPPAYADPDLFEQFRNSVIQCFEFTYELSHKLLRRYLKEISANPEEIVESTFAEIIRTGNEQGLLRSDWARWKVYRQARTDSSHTYDQDKAVAVFKIAPDFLAEAKYLYRELLEKSQDGP